MDAVITKKRLKQRFLLQVDKPVTFSTFLDVHLGYLLFARIENTEKILRGMDARWMFETNCREVQTALSLDGSLLQRPAREFRSSILNR